MPGRNYAQGNKYRYGFNGKENDNDVKGEGNQQDYGMRVYDPRLGRFLKVDPLTDEFPWNSTYAFAENDVIKCIDLDGAEKLPSINQYNYDGSWGWFDVFKFIPNAAGRLYNGAVAGTWNSGVDFFNSLARGTLVKDLKAEGKEIINNIKKEAVATFNYHTSTSPGQQIKDFGNFLTQPQRLEDALLFYAGTKFSLNPGKGNLLLTKTSSTTSAPSFTNARWSQYTHGNSFSTIGQKILGVKNIDEAVEKLISGKLKPENIPIDYIIKDNQIFMLNTRSSVALTKAGIDRNSWKWVNRTGDLNYEKRLINQLDGNKDGYTEIINRDTKEITTNK